MHHLHGVTTLAALAQAGITKDCLPRRPEYTRVARGHYALPGARRDFWFAAAMAQSIAGDDARLTSESALHAMEVLEDAPELVQLVVPEGKGSRKRKDFDVRRSSHLPDAVLTRSGIRLAPVAYALSDVGRDRSDAGVAYAISRCLGLRLVTLAALTATVDARGRFPGSARVRRVLSDFDEGESHSRRERSLYRALVRRGLTPVRQHQILGVDGRILRRADMAIPEVRLDVEVDGPHHFLPAQQQKDRRTDRELDGVRWTVVRYTTYEVDADVEGIADQVQRLVMDRMRGAA